ncbi:gfo/Idh/MocA family oxidoreductase [Candidatus Desantisbacteria bacterium CG_4_10_14_0_8_um_filter_48_22]|uniref:Gfo/Idh/MocA family oxidoreductase n=1 Tax=Candidatus Desantisbacteria bacterium CG_4_10_14_0_8_um_filter_48_22 TaxID=1974543 RepID=A0A2M7S9C0_9BACT|nr:MAG: hypothetical protein AUJ67_02740 [Candidatus Desantisbacteria bacterium CG1_02_49_89]PIV55111.1 MAG: gfo/Idh/MocA family oxidoreductase [Candidatus Desantisbacteria bacterium CG02_land_8_20_14_3_00_49_13]PIZ16145.1 MAG: gfo/Idh/MocA family oxidoreductase [Candidatus Desantisbacteria bacterium CG_4_10_14_0_8_um_filter_48_22]
MVKIGFIGCGGIANAHLDSLLTIADVKVAAACDIVEEKAKAFSQKSGGANVYTDHHLMFEKESLDAVYICLVPSAHTDQELIACKKKIHFFVEKPVALSMKKAAEISAAVKKAGIATNVGYVIRYVDSVWQAKDFLKGKQPAVMHAFYMCPFVPTPWWRRMKDSGGQVVEQSTHIYDLARYLLGDVDSVYALGYRGLQTDIPENDIDDASNAMLHFKSGAAGNVLTTCLMKAGGGMGVDIVLKHARMFVDMSVFRLTNGETKEIKPTNDPRLEENKAFIEAVKTGDRSGIRCDYEDGMKTLEVTLAVNESIRTGRIIKIKS